MLEEEEEEEEEEGVVNHGTKIKTGRDFTSCLRMPQNFPTQPVRANTFMVEWRELFGMYSVFQ